MIVADILKKSKKLRKEADVLLSSSKIVELLNKYGEVVLTGSYKADLMASGDIDVYVLRENEFSLDETLKIFNDIVKSKKFYKFSIGDWKTYMQAGLPESYFIGLKKWQEGIRWEIDIWLLSNKQYDKIKERDINSIKFTEAQKLLILKCKEYRNSNSIDIASVDIYDAVLNGGVKSLQEFKNYLKEKDS